MKRRSWKEPRLSSKLVALKEKMVGKDGAAVEEAFTESLESESNAQSPKKEGSFNCQLCFKVFGFRSNFQRHLNSGKCNLICDEGHDHDFIFRKFSEFQKAKDYISDELDVSKEFIIRNSRPKSHYFVYVCAKRETHACFARFSLQENKTKFKHSSSLQKTTFVLKGCLTHCHTLQQADSASFSENVDQIIDNCKSLISILGSLKESPRNASLAKKLLIDSSTTVSKLLYNELCTTDS